MLALIEAGLFEIATLAPEFALLFGIPDLRPLRRRVRLTVRHGRDTRIVVV